MSRRPADACRSCCARRAARATAARAQHSQSLEAWLTHVPGPEGRDAEPRRPTRPGCSRARSPTPTRSSSSRTRRSTSARGRARRARGRCRSARRVIAARRRRRDDRRALAHGRRGARGRGAAGRRGRHRGRGDRPAHARAARPRGDRRVGANAPAGWSSRTRRSSTAASAPRSRREVARGGVRHLDAPIARVGAPFAPDPAQPAARGRVPARRRGDRRGGEAVTSAVIAAVTEGVGADGACATSPSRGEPGPGEVLVRPDGRRASAARTSTSSRASCPSTRAGRASRASRATRSRRRSRRSGPGARGHASADGRALPLTACGALLPVPDRAPNVCVQLQPDRHPRRRRAAGALRIAADARSSRSRATTPEVAALVEPVSIAVQAVHRGRVARDEQGGRPRRRADRPVAARRGAGPRRERAARRPGRGRLATASALGAAGRQWTTARRSSTHALDWTGGEGPQVVIDATGVPGGGRAPAIEMVCSAGRFVQVGHVGRPRSTLRVGSLTEKELDVLGVACCGTGEFARGRRSRRAQRRPARPAGQPRVRARASARGARTSRWSTRRGDEGCRHATEPKEERCTTT